MKLNKLLGSDFIDPEIVRLALANRQLLKRGIRYPQLDLFNKIKLYNAPNQFTYWVGDIEVIKKGLAVCSDRFYPIWETDVFEIKMFGRESEHMRGDFFNEIILDGLVELENLTPSNRFDFKLYNFESIRLVRFEEIDEEVINYFENIDSNSLLAIRKQLVFLLNDNFPTLKIEFEDLLDFDWFQKKYEKAFDNYNHLKPILFNRISPALIKYLDTNNSLYLIQIIDAISNY